MIKRVALLLFITLLLGCQQDDQTAPRTFLIPEGYIGWVKVQFDEESAKNQPPSDGPYMVYNVNAKGMTKTSEQSIHEGWATNRYYYVNKDRKRIKNLFQEK